MPRWVADGRPDFPTMKIVVGRALALRAPDKELPDRRRRLYENLPKPAVPRLIEEARSKRSECTPLTDRRRGLAGPENARSYRQMPKTRRVERAH